MSEQKDKEMGRREFLQAAAITGAGIGVAGFSGYKVLRELGLRPEEYAEQVLEQIDWFRRDSEQISRATRLEEELQKATSTPNDQEEVSSTQEVGPQQEATETALEEMASVEKEEEKPLTFAGIEFGEPSKPIKMLLNTKEGNVEIPPFFPHPWTENTKESNVFNADNETGVSWQYPDGKILTWLHSGLPGPLHPLRESGYTMWQVQKFIEEQGTGNRQPYYVVNEFLQNVIRGSEIEIFQTGEPVRAKITAAVRVPPLDVIESTQNVAEEVEEGEIVARNMHDWLAEKYPGTGWEEIKDKNEVLMIKFCGRSVAGKGEREEDWPDDVKNIPAYQKARFILACEPVE